MYDILEQERQSRQQVSMFMAVKVWEGFWSAGDMSLTVDKSTNLQTSERLL